MRFTPSNLTIHVGDTVQWTQTAALTPHTVTLTSGASKPDMALVQPQAGGPPKSVVNPAVLLPAGGATYGGTGCFNSGFILGAQSGGSGPQSYSLTFTKPGTYEYICVPHDMMGMNGHITVLAAGQPGMPMTGRVDYAWMAWLRNIKRGRRAPRKQGARRPRFMFRAYCSAPTELAAAG